jgi:hypothetical protein
MVKPIRDATIGFDSRTDPGADDSSTRHGSG